MVKSIVTSVMGCLLWLALGFGASFTTPRFDVDVSIKNDGNATVQEIISLDFTTPQNSFKRVLPLRSEGRSPRYQFVSARVKEGKSLREIPFQQSHVADFIVKITDPKHPFHAHTVLWLTYKVSEALTYENNLSRFVWQAIPPQWPTPIAESSVTVHYETDSQRGVGLRIGSPRSLIKLNLAASYSSGALPGQIQAAFPSRSEFKARALRPIAPGEGLTFSLWLESRAVATCHDDLGGDCSDLDGTADLDFLDLIAGLGCLCCTVVPLIAIFYWIRAILNFKRARKPLPRG